MKISVVILHYKAEDFLRLCLRSVERAVNRVPEAEIIVADNAGSDFPLAAFQREFPSVKFISFPENYGFAKGNNLAVKQARGEYILLLNPDTVIPEDLLENLYAHRLQHSRTGISAGRMIDGAGNFLPESKRNIPGPLGGLGKVTGMGSFLPFSGLQSYYNNDLREDECGRNDVFTGAFMFFKKQDYIDLGGFDERYFMYGEDIDLSRRFMEAGKPGYYCGQWTVIHFKGESTPKTPVYQRHFIDAVHLYQQKFNPKRAKWMRPFIEALFAWRFGLQRLKDKWRKTRAPKPFRSFYGWGDEKHFSGLRLPGNAKWQMYHKGDKLPRSADLIFDTESLSFKEIIDFMIRYRGNDYRYWFYLPEKRLLIGSPSSRSRGEVIRLTRNNE